MRKNVAIALLTAGAVSAPEAIAQVIQLPTVRVFSVTGSVSVPDGGWALLGGNSRMVHRGQTIGGPLGQLSRARGSGRSVNATRAYVGATIIDHAELDAQVLSQAPPRSLDADQQRNIRETAAFLRQHMARNDVASSQASGGRRNAMTGEQAVAWIARGEQLEQEDKPAIAKIYYRTVARHAPGPERHTARERLLSLDEANRVGQAGSLRR
jgi:hypothetical protein